MREIRSVFEIMQHGRQGAQLPLYLLCRLVGLPTPRLTQTLFQGGVEKLKWGGRRCLVLGGTHHDQNPSKEEERGLQRG